MRLYPRKQHNQKLAIVPSLANQPGRSSHDRQLALSYVQKVRLVSQPCTRVKPQSLATVLSCCRALEYASVRGADKQCCPVPWAEPELYYEADGVINPHPFLIEINLQQLIATVGPLKLATRFCRGPLQRRRCVMDFSVVTMDQGSSEWVYNRVPRNDGPNPDEHHIALRPRLITQLGGHMVLTLRQAHPDTRFRGGGKRSEGVLTGRLREQNGGERIFSHDLLF
jgi:hypothetical protein